MEAVVWIAQQQAPGDWTRSQLQLPFFESDFFVWKKSRATNLGPNRHKGRRCDDQAPLRRDPNGLFPSHLLLETHSHIFGVVWLWPFLGDLVSAVASNNTAVVNWRSWQRGGARRGTLKPWVSNNPLCLDSSSEWLFVMTKDCRAYQSVFLRLWVGSDCFPRRRAGDPHSKLTQPPPSCIAFGMAAFEFNTWQLFFLIIFKGPCKQSPRLFTPRTTVHGWSTGTNFQLFFH